MFLNYKHIDLIKGAKIKEKTKVLQMKAFFKSKETNDKYLKI